MTHITLERAVKEGLFPSQNVIKTTHSLRFVNGILPGPLGLRQAVIDRSKRVAKGQEDQLFSESTESTASVASNRRWS